MKQGGLETSGKLSLAAAALLVVVISGCASIAFFPKGTAQKAADKVIDDIWPASPSPEAVVAKPAEPAKTVVKQ